MVWWSKYDKNVSSQPVQKKKKNASTEVGDGLTPLEHRCDSDIVTKPNGITRLTPFIVTLGKSSKTAVDMKNLIEAGMNIARIRLSWISREENIAMLKSLKEAVQTCCVIHDVQHWPIAVAMDLRTCIIRSGLLKLELNDDRVYMEENSEVIVTCAVSMYHQCDQHMIFVDYSYLTNDIKVGMDLSISQGELVLTCTEIIDETQVKCIVKKSGILKSMSLVSIRGMTYSAPNITQRDIDIIEFAMEYDLDILIIPYVRVAETLREVKHHLGNKRSNIKIFAQICTQQGIDNLDDIMEGADGLIIGREFLSFELASERAVFIQKYITAKCKQAAKPMFLSGNTLHDLLTKNVLKTDNISDMTNLLLDGVNGFMIKDFAMNLSTLLLTIRTMDQLCKSIEPIIFDNDFWRLHLRMQVPLNTAEACTESCVLSARASQAAAILLVTSSGRTAQAVSSLRPACPVLAITTNEKVARTLHVYRGVFPLLYTGASSNTWQKETNERVRFAMDFAVNKGMVMSGQLLVVLFRASPASCYCDALQIREVTSKKIMLWNCED